MGVVTVGLAAVVFGLAWGAPSRLGVGTCSPGQVEALDLGGDTPLIVCRMPSGSTPLSARGSSPTAAPTPSPTPTAASATESRHRPTPANTGVPAGLHLTSWDKPLTFTVNNVTLDRIDFHGYPRISGSNITLTNCRFTSFVFYGPGPLTMKNCDGTGNLNIDAYYRDINGILLDGVNLDIGAHDGFDLFSSAQGRISNVTIVNSIVHGMDFPPESKAHGDAMQVRGITHLRVLNTVLDDGPYQHQKNSAFYLENVHGGLNDVLIADSWLSGGGYTFYSNFVNPGVARNVHIDSVGHWGLLRAKGGWTFVNVTGPTGAPISPEG